MEKIVKCENCGKSLFVVNDDGLVMFATCYVSKIDGACECGHGFHFSVTDRLLERIIGRYNERKMEVV